MWPLSRALPQWQGPAILALPSSESIDLLADKYRTVCLARDLEIPAPETVLVSTRGELDQVKAWAYPIVVKDRFSVRWCGDKAIEGTVSYALSWDDLVEKVNHRLAAVGDVLVQKFAPGKGIGYSCFAVGDECRLPFQWMRIREKNPRGSGSSARLSVGVHPQVAKWSNELVRRAGFQGIAMVEYKHGASANSYVLMEVNARPWGSIQLPIHCGIDYPNYLVDWWLEGRQPPARIDYPTGINCRWLTADLMHLENLWGGAPPGWPIAYPSFFSNALRICIPWYPGMRYDDLSLSDPLPGLAELAWWLRRRLGFGGRV
jgi:predicted ATP-grasp superfamily ATP-dependent carboligase